MCGLAPSRVLAALHYAGGGWEASTIEMLPTGTVRVLIGTSPHGQGHVTTFSQMVADQLGVEYEDVEVIHGDTQMVPLGLDTYGSRSLAVGGIAAYHAGEKILAKARTLAAHQLECSEDDLEWTPGNFTVAGTDRSVDIKTLAFAAWSAHDLPDGYEPGLTATHIYDPPNFSWPYGAHACVVEVNTETGSVDIQRYIAVNDCGARINPMVIDGQVHGGVAQGIAEALYEEARYDEEGNLVHGTMTTYMVPGRAGAAQLRAGPHRHPEPHEPAGGQGGRRGRHDRRPAGGRRRDRGRPLAPGGHGHRAAGDAREGLEGDPGGAVMIPAAFDYEVAESVDHALRAAAQQGGREAHRGRPQPAAADEAPARPARARSIDIGRLSDLRRGQRQGGPPRHRGAHAPPRPQPRPARQAALPADRPRGRHGGRPPGAPPRHDRRLAGPRRPGLRPARRSA